MVHCACRARPDAAHAVTAAFRVDNVVPLVADRLGGAARLARIAPDAGFRVDQMLPKRRLLLCACLHNQLHSSASSPAFLGWPRQGMRFDARAMPTAGPL